MGCLKLTYRFEFSALKVVSRGSEILGESRAGCYRYGFNGMESDDEIAGSKNIYTATYWEYDSRTGRRWNIDPVVKPYFSSYGTFGGNPIMFADPNGDDWVEGTDGQVTWRDDITSQGDLGDDSKEIYRGTEYIRFENIGETTFNDVHYNNDQSINTTERNRPDNDGVVTNDEALEWWHYAGGASLTVDVSQLDFRSSDLNVGDFTSRGVESLSVNFFSHVDIHPLNLNIPYRPATSEPLSHVFGTLRVVLMDDVIGQVRIATDDATGRIDRYDFKYFEFVAKSQFSNGNPTDFDIFGTGTGIIHLTKPVKGINLTPNLGTKF